MQQGNVLFQTNDSSGYYNPPSTNLEFQQFSYSDKAVGGASTAAVGDAYGGASHQFSAYPTGAVGGAAAASSYGAGAGGNYAAYQHTGEVTWASIRAAFTTGGFADEPPLLEEIEVNFDHIQKKGMAVLNPLGAVDKHIMDDTDLAGPVLFCLLFAGSLLLSGKAQFGYVYGVAMLGWGCIYVILNLMSESGIDGYRVASVLGYCLLPMVLLSSCATLLMLSGHAIGFIGFVFSSLSIAWCTYAASTMFTAVLSMTDQRLLVAYPVGLLYSAFALLAVF
ncbi:uncharacterized protein EV422DRAFT_623534 [Fimicolochytrium jonesii]|uniref:uncharacterized protein n=1 Tax=Fimicolochytrium jonesii TaxID=1396493 RepID=UPI0022FDB27C|nr:uncharacterized protein EV422DRAFT_623534 [Fimicolochytrium jonesii]KAI8816309.1 hypothetical protein EV422DRAFT_623534 [Fimicolochytrium jonesii]